MDDTDAGKTHYYGDGCDPPHIEPSTRIATEMRRESLREWLLKNGYAEEHPGYGHVDAATLADALIAAEWVWMPHDD